MPNSAETAFNKIKGLFQDAPEEEKGEVTLTLTHLLILLSVVDHIAKALLASKAERFVSCLVIIFPGLDEDWVKSYLHNAEYIFCTFRHQYGCLPTMGALLQRLTNLNSF